MKLIDRPVLAACLFGVAILGPLGCASQNAGPGSLGMDDSLQPFAIDPQLTGVATNGAQGTLTQSQMDPWPRQVALTNALAEIYLPQVNSWTGNMLSFRAAVSVRVNGAKDETFGVITGSARTDVDGVTRTVALNDLVLTQAKFPTLADNGLGFLSQLREQLPATMATMSLDLLAGQLAASQTVKPEAVAVNNQPPKVIISYSPAILVPIDGAPSIKPVPDTRFERVINTQALIARTGLDQTWYMHVFDSWMSAPSLDGPWVVSPDVPPGLDDLASSLAKKGSIDLLDGGPQVTPKPSLASGAPAIYVTQTPAELIVFKGQPNFVPVTGTELLWANNTTADVLVNTSSNDYYTLLSGRWYRAGALSGPWTFTQANSLPVDFARIPKAVPAGVILASVAGTPQAQEALIANSIPQTATVPLVNGPTFTPVFDGAPTYRAIDGTLLRYVANAQQPIIQVSPTSYYGLEAGVWFTAQSLTGPWFVATTVPPVIYSIPASSPLHYVTYVQVYGASTEVVYTGYTPGYLGTVVAPDGVVVYGTGYTYTPPGLAPHGMPHPILGDWLPLRSTILMSATPSASGWA